MRAFVCGRGLFPLFDNNCYLVMKFTYELFSH